MSHYELTFITRAEEDNGGVADLVAQLGGSMKHQLPPTRRKLAYPIKKETAGVYFTYEFDLPQEKVAELDKKLLRNEHVLRHLVIADGIRKDIEVPRKLKEGSLEIPESLTKGMAELAEAEKAAAEPVSAEVAVPEKTEEPADGAPAEELKADRGASAEELTAEERQKKLDEKLKSILG